MTKLRTKFEGNDDDYEGFDEDDDDADGDAHDVEDDDKKVNLPDNQTQSPQKTLNLPEESDDEDDDDVLYTQSYDTTEEKVEPKDSTETEKSSVLGSVGNFVGAVGGDIAEFAKSNLNIRGGRFELPSALLRGSIEGVAQGVDMFGDVFSKLSFSPYRPYEFAEKDIEQKYGDGNPYSEEVKKRKQELGLTGENIAHKLSDVVSRSKEVFPQPKTVTGNIIEVISQYATGYKALGTVMKGGHKALYTKEFMTGFGFFSAEDELLSNLMQESNIKLPFITDLLAKDMDDSKFEKRLKSGIEATLLLAPFDIPKVVKYFKNVRTHKQNKELAEKELLEDGVVSEETANALANSAEVLTDVSDLSGIQLSPKSAELAEKEGWTRSFAKVVEKTEKQKLIKNIENAELAKKEPETEC